MPDCASSEIIKILIPATIECAIKISTGRLIIDQTEIHDRRLQCGN
jgi:hypothetical protein